MSLVVEQHAFALDLQQLISYAVGELHLMVTYGEVYRTPEQQAIYVKDGRSKTMNSYHLRRLAADLNFFRDGAIVTDWETMTSLGRYWESLNLKNRWGGNFDRDWNPDTGFKDWPHFERRV